MFLWVWLPLTEVAGDAAQHCGSAGAGTLHGPQNSHIGCWKSVS